MITHLCRTWVLGSGLETIVVGSGGSGMFLICIPKRGVDLPKVGA